MAIHRISLKLGRLSIGAAGLMALAVGWLLLTAGPASAQPDVAWSLTLGGSGDDFAHAVIETSDGGFLVAGETGSSGAGGQDVWLVKLGPEGGREWDRTFGGPEDDVGYDVQQSGDGGYIIAAETHSFGAGSAAKSDYWLIKTDSMGHMEWQRTFGNLELPGSLDVATNDVPQTVKQTADLGYIMAGFTRDRRQEDVWLVKTDSSGEPEWSSQLGGRGDDRAYEILQTGDGGFVAAGKTESFGAGGSDFWLVKTGPSGETEWARTYGGKYNDEARGLVATLDGGYALGGFSWSFGAGLSDYWLVKTDGAGDLKWDRTFGGVPRDAAHGLEQAPDGGLVLAGWSESFAGGDGVWLVKTDLFGNLRWEKAYGGSSGARSVVRTDGGGYVVAGWTGPLEGVRDIWVMRTSGDGPETQERRGPVAVLVNEGTAPITAAAVGFNAPGSTGPNPFHFNGLPLGNGNPLPPGSLACTNPLEGIESGSRLITDQMRSLDRVFIDELTSSLESLGVVINSSRFSFEFLTGEFETDGSEEERVAGAYSIVSESPCEPVRASLGPPAPTGLRATGSRTGSGAVELAWVDRQEAEAEGYRVYVSPNETGPYVRTGPETLASRYTDTGLINGVSYYYAVTAVDSAGRETPMSRVVKGTPLDLTPPAPPTGLTVLSLDRESGVAGLAWSTSPEEDIRGYKVYRSLNEGPWTPITVVGQGQVYTDRTVPAEGRVTYVVTAYDRAGNESLQSNIAPPELDFFGTIADVQPDGGVDGSLVIDTIRGRVQIRANAATSIQLPQNSDASLSDLAPGDVVAVSLHSSMDGALADVVRLISGVTVNRHVSGVVTYVSSTALVVRALGPSLETITFQLLPSVQVNYHHGMTHLAPGAFVIISVVADPGTGAISPLANEVNVAPVPRETSDGQQPPASTVTSVIRGVFLGIDSNTGDMILSDATVALDSDTEIAEGLGAGDEIRIEAIVKPGGVVLARRVEKVQVGPAPSEQMLLEGVFLGFGLSNSQWNVGGIRLTVDHRTLTDGLPEPGQPVRVKALLQADGRLLARETRIQPGRPGNEMEAHRLMMEGTLSPVSGDGDWRVSGSPLTVGPTTRLEGALSVGGRVAVEATSQDGRLLAQRVHSVEGGQTGGVKWVTVRGTVDAVQDGGPLVVNGVSVALSLLTEMPFAPEVGDAVEIRALINSSGALVADQVNLQEGETGETRAYLVDVYGVIDGPKEDGGLTINGLPLSLSPLSQVGGGLEPGSNVRVLGVLQSTGEILVREVLDQRRRIGLSETSARLQGLVPIVSYDSQDNIVSFVVAGIKVTMDDLTRSDVELATGTEVSVSSVVKDGVFLAVAIGPHAAGGDEQSPAASLEGTVQIVDRDSEGVATAIAIGGLKVTIGPESIVHGRLVAGIAVRLVISVSGGLATAAEVWSEDGGSDQEQLAKFKIEGHIEQVHRNEAGDVVGITVDGDELTIEPLTVIQAALAPGTPVVVEGVVHEGRLLAATIAPSTGEQPEE